MRSVTSFTGATNLFLISLRGKGGHPLRARWEDAGKTTRVVRPTLVVFAVYNLSYLYNTIRKNAQKPAIEPQIAYRDDQRKRSSTISKHVQRTVTETVVYG